MLPWDDKVIPSAIQTMLVRWMFGDEIVPSVGNTRICAFAES